MADPDAASVLRWLSDTVGAGASARAESDVRTTGRVLLGLGWQQRSLILPALVAAVTLAGLALVPPILLADLIDRAFPTRQIALGLAIGAGIAAIASIDALCSLARRLFAARAGLRLQSELLMPIYGAVLRLPVDHKLAGDQGLLGQTFEEVERLAQNATEGLIEFGMAAGMIGVLSVTLFFVDWRTALAIVAIVGLLAALHVVAAHSLRRRETVWFEARSHYWSHLVESIAYADTVRFNAAYGFAEARFAARRTVDLKARFATIQLSAMLDAVGRLAAGLIVAAIALLGGWRVMGGQMSVGDFVLVLSIGGSLSAPVLALVKAFDDFQTATISVSRLAMLAEAKGEDVPSDFDDKAHRPVRLEVEDLSFAYGPDREPVISHLSFALEPGERVALVGPSGIGKSTLASLIFAARRPGAGTVRLDGVALHEMPLADLRRRIVIVPHEIDVFTGTVAENIALSPEIGDFARIEGAARAAGIDAEIRQLPQGYETLLGQGGLELSAGQKQRLGIARAMVRTPDILVLDESTSSLDLDTERRVLDGVLGLPGVTVVAITHRQSVVERMDRVIQI